MSIQPLTSQPVAQPAATIVPGRDLVSIRDLSPIEVESLFHLAAMMKARPEDFRTDARRKAHRDVFREAVAAHAPDV